MSKALSSKSTAPGSGNGTHSLSTARDAVETISAHVHSGKGDPDPTWVRGTCPSCHGPLVSNCYYQGGKGYFIVWECWYSLGPEEERTCDYHRVL